LTDLIGPIDLGMSIRGDLSNSTAVPRWCWGRSTLRKAGSRKSLKEMPDPKHLVIFIWFLYDIRV
jgi:hypothetical protein